MQKVRFFKILFTAIAFAVTTNVFAGQNTLLILQAGAATNGAISHSFVELYNAGDEEIDLTDYSLQYSNNSGIEWNKINLSKTILPKHSFLILGDKGTPIGSQYEIPDGSGDINESFVLSNNQFKVVLMSNTALLDMANPFEAEPEGYVDMLGAINGTSIDGFETEVMPKISKQQTARRVSLVDSDNNATDFTNIDYRTTAASIGDKYPKNHDYGEWEPIEIEIPTIAGSPDPLAGKLLIFQVGAGKDGAILHSFVELYNNSDAPITLDDKYSLQYTTGTGIDWKVIKLEGTIPAQTSFLIRGQEGKTSADTRLIINEYDQYVPDFVLSNNDFKVAIMGNQNKLTVVNPFDMSFEEDLASVDYVDMVGAINGTNADGYETSVVKGMSKQKSVRRVSLDDTDNNSKDFGIIDYRTSGTTNDDFAKYKPRSLINGIWEPFPKEPILSGEKDELAGKLLILQAYGSSSDATGATHSFVELYNKTYSEINLNGISLHYANGTDAGEDNVNTNTEDEAWESVPLSGTIPARTSFLILGNKQNSTGILEIAENSGDINNTDFTLSDRAFKVAIIRSTNGYLTTQNPFDMDGNGTTAAGYIDMVGAENDSPRDLILGFETTPVQNSASKSVRRVSLVDSDNNSADFESIVTEELTEDELNFYSPKNLAAGAWNPIYDDTEINDLAEQIVEFKFSYQNLGWGDNGYWEGEIDHLEKTITFTTQQWIKNIDKLIAEFVLDGEGTLKVNGKPQTSGFTQNDFKKEVIYSVGEFEYKVKFISPQATGIPVIWINTNNVPINSTEDYRDMSFTFTDPNNSGNNVSRVGLPKDDRIRGRGNISWTGYPKKSYRVRFREDVSFFGLAARENWILLGEYIDPTFLMNATAFHLGSDIFDNQPFTCSYHHVQVYLNGEYDGIYGLTEHRQADPKGIGAPGRVKIGKNGWFVSLDSYYDEDPKFMIPRKEFGDLPLPIMIKSPEAPNDATNSDNPFYDFIKKDWNELVDSMYSPNFPDNGYGNLIDMDNFIDYFIINDFVANDELVYPKSAFAYKSVDGKISMGPLWDYDWAYFRQTIGGHSLFRVKGTDTWTAGYRDFALKHAFFNRFFEDPVFLAAYKERWNEKRSQILAVADSDNFIDAAKKLESTWQEDKKRWKTTLNQEDSYLANYPENFIEEIENMKIWWGKRVNYFDSEVNKVEVLPKSKTFAAKNYGYSEIAAEKITIVAYDVVDLTNAYFQKLDNSGFEGGFEKSETGKGGYFITLNIKPKNSLDAGMYTDVLVLKCKNQGKSFTFEIPLSFEVKKANQEPLVINTIGTKTYGDPNFTLTTTGGSGTGTVVFNQFGGKEIANVGSDGEVEIVSAGGVWAVWATKAADKNYNVINSMSIEIIINKAIPTIDLLNYDLSKVDYNGTAKTPVVSKKNNVVGLGNISLVNSDGSPFSAINRGVYPVYVAISEGSNYLATKEPIYLGEFEILMKYNVVFNSVGGSSVATQQIYHDNYAIEPTLNPTKTGHEFIGWYLDDELFNFDETPITQNITLMAKWSVNSYTISWYINGESMQSSAVEYGIMPVFSGETPTKATTAQYIYEFTGWLPKVAIVSAAQTYVAQFSQTTRLYEVKFVSDDETIETKSVTYESKTSSITPNKEGYTLVGWYLYDEEFDFNTPIIQNIILTAKWKINSYLISFVVNDEIIGSESLEYGAIPVFTGETPTKETTAQYIYKFTGWLPEITSVSGIQTYTAQFNSTLRSYKVMFVSDEETIETKNVDYGSTISTIDTLNKENHKFVGWHHEGMEFDFDTPITQDIMLTAKWEESHFWIYFIMKGFPDKYDSVLVEKGETTIPPEAPDGLVFIKWLMPNGKEFDFNTPITLSMTLTALWSEITTPIDTTKSESKYGIIVTKNPVSDKAEIFVNVELGIRNVELAVYDVIGNVVYNTKSNNGEFVWDLTNNNGRFVANGTYIVVVEAKGQSGKVYRYSAKLGVKK